MPNEKSMGSDSIDFLLFIPIMVFMLDLELYEYFGLIVMFYSNEQEPIHSTNTNRGQTTI